MGDFGGKGAITEAKPRRKQPPVRNVGSIEQWSPPDFGDSKKARIAASVVVEFVKGHNASDVLRELVQNEFDGGGDKLIVNFGHDALDVIGNGRGIDADGWKRLSVIVGTGAVIGDRDADSVAAKTNSIGSKNFGLRSLFIFGDQIFVRSKGQVCVMDLPTYETGKVADPLGWKGGGVKLRIPYRVQAFDRLEPFTTEHERHAFDLMAGGMLSTLVKLALVGRKRGLREVTLSSARTGRKVTWNQKAEGVPTRIKGIDVTRRTGRLTRSAGTFKERRKSFEEIEFATSVDVPAEFADRSYPAYFRTANGQVKLAVSLPLSRQKLDRGRLGNFYYPLQAPNARTGCSISVSAPFELNNDRSKLVENRWNEWLANEAAKFTVALLKVDWFDRFGADAFGALTRAGDAEPSVYIEKVESLLGEEACWPTKATGSERFCKASDCVIPTEPLLDGFLSDSRHLDPLIMADAAAKQVAERAGAKRFSIASLIRLRCAREDATTLATKLTAHDANYHYPDYDAALSNEGRQVAMVSALTTLLRRLPKGSNADLAGTPSTLAASGELRPAQELVLVDQQIWDACPEPLRNRLHPSLNTFRAIARHCTPFDEESWIISAAGRAVDGVIDEAEREALYARLLSNGATMGKRAMAALRNAPIAKDHHGEWAAPATMVLLKGATARLMSPVLNAPAKEIVRQRHLMSRLRIREKLSGRDLVAYAEVINERPDAAERFERLLAQNMRLLSPTIIDELEEIEFLKNRAGTLSAPVEMYLDTSINRLCVDDEKLIVGGNNELLYRKLRISDHPSLDTILATIDAWREFSEPPARPELLYQALQAALARERRPKSELADREILWVDNNYRAPTEVVVGTNIPHLLDEAVPILRRSDELSRSYLALGASSYPNDDHWAAYFEYVSDNWDRDPVDERQVRQLQDAYRIRGSAGLPNLINDAECLVARNRLLYTLNELHSGLIIENDHPALAAALAEADDQIGIVDPNERTRAFFARVGIKPLSSIAGSGRTVFGPAANRPAWLHQRHTKALLDLIHDPQFARAVHELANIQRHNIADFELKSLRELTRRLRGIADIAFYQSIERHFTVAGNKLMIAVEVAVTDTQIGIVAPRSIPDFQQLAAQALAELAGATNVGQVRVLASTFYPLTGGLSARDLPRYLERMGVNVRGWEDASIEPELEFENSENVSNELTHQLIDSLNITGGHEEPPPSPPPPPATAPPHSPPAPVPPPPLPDIDDVNLSVADTNQGEIQPRQRRSGSQGSGSWSPPTPTQVERDRQIGLRGEELVYLEEIKRLRRAGHPDPESVVVWTSRNDPGADHDIRSVDDQGRPRWIEVKSTTGVDGRFEWSRKEFEKALRERDRYELWRVYRADSTMPVAKCFPNPAEMLGASTLILELGTLRAAIESMS